MSFKLRWNIEYQGGINIKKFVIGLVIGVSFGSSIYSFAETFIDAKLFPCTIFFHKNATINKLAPDAAVTLNYDNRVYVPLRVFSEATGGIVDYKPSSSETNNQNHVDIYYNTNLVLSNTYYSDSEGYVTIQDLNVTRNKSGETIVTGGTIRITKDIRGKTVDIYSLFTDGGQLVSKNKSRVLLTDSAATNLKPGDILSFETYLVGWNPEGYKVEVNDILTPVKLGSSSAPFGEPNGNPICVTNSPLFGGDLTIVRTSPDGRAFFNFGIYNCGNTNIELDPFEVRVEFSKQNEQGVVGPPTYVYDLPVISGLIDAKSGFEVVFEWDKKTADGLPAAPGTYLVSYSIPNTYSYTVLGDQKVYSKITGLTLVSQYLQTVD